MAKMALCIRRRDLLDLNRILRYPELTGLMLADAPEEFLRLETTLQDRATCETDPSLLQLLPYVLIQRADTEQYFVYCRGKGGNEQRLHGNLSVGVGGHPDTAVPEDKAGFSMYAEDLLAHLTEHALREVTEEIGVQFISDYADENDYPAKALEIPEEMWTGTLISDYTNSVGQVHLGLLFILVIPDDSFLGSAEEGCIEGSQWLTAEELLEPQVFDRLENWSKAVVTSLQDYSDGDLEDADLTDD